MNYEQAIQTSYERPVVVLFSTATCAPCKVVKPMMDKLSDELQFPLARIDALEQQELFVALGLRSVPTLLVFRNGERVDALAGHKPESYMRMWLAKNGVTA